MTISLDDTKPWDWYVARAELLRQVTTGKVWLNTHYGEPFDATRFPWHLAMLSAEAGSGWYGSVPSGLRFTATHECGLRFEWTVDFYKPHDGGEAVDVETLGVVLRALPSEEARAIVRAALAPLAGGLRKHRDDAKAEVARREASLRALASHGVE